MNTEFIEALEQENLNAIRRLPKSDLHNHFVLGGSRNYLKEYTGRDIQPIKKPLQSMDEMHAWNSKNIGDYFNSPEGRRILIRATFEQAKEDGVSILEIGEDVWVSSNIIGSVELFHRCADDDFNGVGVLRIDLGSDYEKSSLIKNVLDAIVPSAYEMFDCEEIISKVPIYAVERAQAFSDYGFEKSEKFLVGTIDHYAYKDYWTIHN